MLLFVFYVDQLYRVLRVSVSNLNFTVIASLPAVGRLQRSNPNFSIINEIASVSRLLSGHLAMTFNFYYRLKRILTS
jgi:hypothetical protein